MVIGFLNFNHLTILASGQYQFIRNVTLRIRILKGTTKNPKDRYGLQFPKVLKALNRDLGFDSINRF